MPAGEAGLQIGDKILATNGDPVDGFSGGLDSITQRIVFSKGDSIRFTVERGGKELDLVSGFEVESGGLLRRDGVRRVGISPYSEVHLSAPTVGSPAELSGFKAGDRILSVDGVKVMGHMHYIELEKEANGKFFNVMVERDGERLALKTVGVVPANGYKRDPNKDAQPMTGVVFGEAKDFKIGMMHPSPGKQLGDSAKMLLVTLDAVTSKDSGIGIGHMSGPVGIGKMKYLILLGEHPFRMMLFFWVIFNVNLAVFNMLPFPVLDGGHIVMAIGEWVRGKPMNTRLLESIQTVFVLLLLGMFLFVTMKDSFTSFSGDTSPKVEGPQAPEWDLEKLKAMGFEAKS